MKSYFDIDQYSNQRLLVIPQEPEAHAKLQSIDRKTRHDVQVMYGIISESDWQMNTIANTAMETLIELLHTQLQLDAGMSGANGPIAACNFYDTFFIKATNRITEEADKEGNINIEFQAGPRAIALISQKERPPLPPKVSPIERYGMESELPALHELFDRVDRTTRYALSKKYRFVMADNLKFGTLAVLDQFMLNLFEYLLFELGQDQDKAIATVNFNENVEIHALRNTEDGTIQLKMRPGMNAKLLIKNDGVTESDLSQTDAD